MPRKKPPIDDEVLSRALEVLEKPASSAELLTEELRLLTAGYRTLLRKLHKTLIISDRYQDQLRQFNTTLTQRVEEETERRLAQERLLAQNAKMAAMGEMIDAIAHQWRQPLATLDILVQNIREARRQDKLDDIYLDRATDRALSQILFMSETIATFRRFFRQEKRKESFSVSARVTEAVALLNAQMRRDTITLEISVQPEDDRTCGLPNEFAQVVVNLLTNARDAILELRRNDPSPGMDRRERDRITVQVFSIPERVVLEVRDNGAGIPAEAAPRLFEPDFSTKKKREGSGLGLYMSRLIVEQSMGGAITFSSTPGTTVFRVEVPRERGETAP